MACREACPRAKALGALYGGFVGEGFDKALYVTKGDLPVFNLAGYIIS